MENQRPKDPSEIGALWSREGRKGPYLSGTINGQDVICFPVGSTNPKAPAWRVLKSQPREQAQQPPQTRPSSGRDDGRPGRW